VIADATTLPDLAVTDLQMPTMNGAQLAARLRSSDPEIKLLFVSGDGSSSLKPTGLLNENAAFLSKPFKPEVMLSEIAVLLDMRHDGHDPHTAHANDANDAELDVPHGDHSLDQS
jgi:DNA-binding response OmpR family regulator